MNETVEHCYTPMVAQCGGGGGGGVDTNTLDQEGEGEGEQLCRETYESSCVTRDTGHAAVTECDKVPVTLCGDRSCAPVAGERTCHDKVRSSVVEFLVHVIKMDNFSLTRGVRHVYG